MQNFIVLGIVPGTNYQLTFMFWVYVATGFVSLLLLAVGMRRRHSLLAYFAARKINRFIARQLQTA